VKCRRAHGSYFKWIGSSSTRLQRWHEESESVETQGFFGNPGVHEAHAEPGWLPHQRGAKPRNSSSSRAAPLCLQQGCGRARVDRGGTKRIFTAHATPHGGPAWKPARRSTGTRATVSARGVLGLAYPEVTPQAGTWVLAVEHGVGAKRGWAFGGCSVGNARAPDVAARGAEGSSRRAWPR